MRPLLLTALIVLLAACGNGTEEAPPPATPASTTPVANDRDSWQRPQELLQLIGPEIKGMTIADLFAGDGYFTFKLIDAGANVIAIDNDPANIALLEERKRALGLGDDRLRIRAVPVGDPGLATAEADMALLTHRYAGIRDKGTFITRLRNGLRPPRPLFIIDWQYRETPVGPPLAERMGADQIMEELGAFGYSDIGAHSAKMPYQVILIATDYIELDPTTYDQMMEGVQVVPQ
jgi:hypothetical protein